MFTAHDAVNQTIDAVHVVDATTASLLGAIAVEPAIAPASMTPARPIDLHPLRMRWTVDSAASGRLRAAGVAA
jgi:hypothetical protein